MMLNKRRRLTLISLDDHDIVCFNTAFVICV